MTTVAVTAEIAEAIEELRETFPEATVTFEGDGTGGAWGTVDPVDLGPAYAPVTSWISFQLTYPYPESDVYPLFVTPDLRRADGTPLGEGFQSAATWGSDAQAGTQLSRRSNRLDPAIDTAATKVLKVLRWLA